MDPYRAVDDNPKAIFLLLALYAAHMVEEFTFGFVEWGDRYFGGFDWTQNLIGNTMFFVLLFGACYAYFKNPAKYLWLGMSGAMWILANSFIHIACTILGKEYSPGVVTAALLYLPGGVYFLRKWARQGVLTLGNAFLSFMVGGVLFMLLPTCVRAILFNAKLAALFHLL